MPSTLPDVQASPNSLLDDAFARLQMASRDACTSVHNGLREPTEAQAKAGNYKKARVTLHGLPLTIENPHGSVRRGRSADGKEWENRMAAMYGDIAGTRGADGDPIDVFVGPFPESRRAWVINQGWPDGGFDEHKVLLGFATEAMARDAYLASYDRGWTGLQSMVALTLEQLKWWLKHGDHARPLSLDQLPFDGAPSMKKTLWTDDAQPLTPMPKLMYELRSEDAEAGLLLDAVTMAELMADPDIEAVSQLDALVVPVATMTMRMDLLQRVMNAAGTSLNVTGYTISDAIRARGVMQVAVLFALSDGQAVTVWFHNPDTTPAKITPFDDLISWKWMLNKKDITIVVAPERGRELNPREVARRIMRLAEKNSEAFKRANAKLAEKMAALEELDTEITQLEKKLEVTQHEIEKARQRIADREAEAAKPLDVTTPEGYRLVLAGDQDLALANQDALDAMFQERYIAVRNALRELGWGGPTYGSLSKNGAALVPDIEKIGAGKNVVGLVYGVRLPGGEEVEAVNQIRDTLEQSPAEIALAVDSLLPVAQAEPEPEPEQEPEQETQPSAEDRAADIREALRALGWTGDVGEPMGKAGYFAVPEMGYVGTDGVVAAPWTIMGVPGFFMSDTLERSAEEMATAIDLGLTSFLAQREEQERAKAAAERAETIARVDAAYQFDNATEAFKLLVAASVDEDDYSAFKSARVLDEAVKAAGGSVAWDVSSVGKLDSVAEDEDDTDPEAEFDAIPADEPEAAVLDGDFPGHPFRGNQYAKASAESGAAVKASQRAKHHEAKGNSKEAKKAHLSAALTHKAAALHAKGRAKSYHRKMAKFHGGRAGAQLDGLLDDASGITDLAVQELAGYAFGSISKDGEVIGRAVISGGDGKAMVYPGAEGNERVKRVDSDYPFFFDEDEDEQRAMVASLFFGLPQAAAEPVEFEHVGRRIYPGKAKLGDEIVTRWAIETAENKARREAGEPTRGGDRLAETEEQAKKIAEEMNADDEREANRQRALAEQEAQEKAAEEARQAELADDDGFADGKTQVQQAKVRGDLMKQIAYKGSPVTLKALVRQRVAAGASVIEAEGQRALTVSATDDGYLLQRQLGKTAIDYAEYLIAKRDAVKDAEEVANDEQPIPSEEQVTPQPETDNEAAPAVETPQEQIAAEQAEAEKVLAMEVAPAVVAPVPENPLEETAPGEVIAPAEVDPELAADRAYLQSLIDGTVVNMLAEETFQRLEPMLAKYEGNAEMMELLDKAATAYGDAAVAAAKKALAG